MSIANYWKEIVSILSLAFIILIELAYRQPLYDYSLDMISDWQRDKGHTLTKFFKAVSFLGTDIALAFILLLTYSLMPRRMFMKIVLTFYMVQNILAFFKIFYHSPRPYFSSDDVLALNCTGGYGNPSGHCMYTVSAFGTAWVLIFANNTEQRKPFFSKNCYKLILQWASFVLIIILILLMFFSRIYLGAHALNQTLYGLTIGLWIVYTVGFVLPKYIDSHFDNFIQTGGLWSLRSKPNLTFFMVVGIFLVLQIANIGLFFGLKDHNSFMKDDWTRKLTDKCPDALDKITPFEDSFKLAVHTSLYFFFYIAQLISAKFSSRVFNYWYSHIGVGRHILRMLFVALTIAVCLMTSILIKKPFVMFLCLGVLLGNIAIGFLGLPFIDYICEKYGLIKAPIEKPAITDNV